MSSRSVSYQQTYPQTTRTASRTTQDFHASGAPSSELHASGLPQDVLVESLSQLRAKYTRLMHVHITALREQFRLDPHDAQRRTLEIPGCPVVDSLHDTVPKYDVFEHIARCERGFPVNARTADDHIKAATFSNTIALSLVNWLNDQDPALGSAVDKRTTAILDIMSNRPATQPRARAPSVSVPSVQPRSLAWGEFCPFRNPAALYGKTFKVDNLVFKVIACQELRNGETEFRLRYDIADEPVEVGQQDMQLMLESCLYYPVS